MIIEERSTPSLPYVLTDEDGVGISGLVLDDLTLSLYFKSAESGVVVINNRNEQDALGAGSGANDVTIDTSGNILWSTTEADTTVIASADRPIVVYTARWDVRYTVASKPRHYSFEHTISIRRLDALP